MNKIRHISASYSGNKIALGEFEKVVQIFDIDTLNTISEFNSILSFGGKRITINELGNICVCGAWAKFGLVGYNALNGEVIWQRKDLKKVQHLSILRSNSDLFFANFSKSASKLISFKDGSEINKIIGVENYYESRFEPINVYDKSTSIELVNRITGNRISKIDRQTFATLSLDFAKDCFCVSEAAGPISCYELDKGRLKWRLPIGMDGHYLSLAYNELLDRFIGISWPYLNGGDMKIHYMNPDSGKNDYVINIKKPAVTEFAKEGRLLITSNKEIIDINTGEKKYWA